MTKYLKYLVGLALLANLTACVNREQDRQAPSLRLLRVQPDFSRGMICGTEENLIQVLSGDTLSIDVLYEDDQALGQYKIDVHHNFDCHGHRSPNLSQAWSILELGDLTGQSVEKRFSYIVPDDVRAGAYHFQLWVLDEAGNDAEALYYYHILARNRRDTLAPNFSVQGLTAGQRLEVTRGLSQNLSLEISDNLALDQGRIELSYLTQSGNRAIAGLFNLSGNSPTALINFEFSLGSSLPLGVYPARFSVYDAYGNVSDLDFELLVS